MYQPYFDCSKMNLDDTDESDGDKMKINEADRNVEADGEFHPGFVSEWGDEDTGVEKEENPHGTYKLMILYSLLA